MAETLFHFDPTNYLDLQDRFRGIINQEYYLGDLTIDTDSVVDIHAERRVVGPASIVRLRSRTEHCFRRTRAHIRMDASDVSVLWFMRRGRLGLTSPSGSKVANPADFIITRSTAPFCITCWPDARLVHESVHLTIPTHVLREHVPQDSNGLFIAAMPRQLVLAESLLEHLLDDDGATAPDTAQIVLDTALTLVGHAIRDSGIVCPTRKTVTDRRLEEVLRFIEVHLTDPSLNTSAAAAGCHISPRYLSFLLSQHGTTFSKLVWEQRLEKAAKWIAAADPKSISLTEIGYSLGFKSPAHFSRSFSRTFGVSPREYRIRHGHGHPAQDIPPTMACTAAWPGTRSTPHER
jgi:AraC-like DNA-binding protein